MATLKELFKLANDTYGESNQIAMKLLMEKINKLDWDTMDGDLLAPLTAVYDTIPPCPSRDGYKELLIKTNDYIQHLKNEAEKVPHLQTAFENLRCSHQH